MTTPKRKRGPKPKPDGEALNQIIQAKFTKVDFDAICAIASQCRLPVAVMVREWVRSRVRRELAIDAARRRN